MTGSMRVGLRSLTVTVGWHNVEAGGCSHGAAAVRLKTRAPSSFPRVYRVTRMMNLMRSKGRENAICGDAFPIEGVLVATYLLTVEALPHCR